MEYFLTDKSSITGSVFGRFTDEQDITENNTTRYNQTVINSNTFRNEEENQDDQSYQVSLNYTNSFNEAGQKLTADFQYSYDKEIQPTIISENNTFPDTELLARENIYETQLQNEFLLQADYVLPIGDAQFEAGYRGNFEESSNDYQLDQLNLNTGEFETNLGLTNIFTYTQNINALYTQYGNKYGKFS